MIITLAPVVWPDPGMAIDLELSITGVEPCHINHTLLCHVMNLPEPLHLNIQAEFIVSSKISIKCTFIKKKLNILSQSQSTTAHLVLVLVFLLGVGISASNDVTFLLVVRAVLIIGNFAYCVDQGTFSCSHKKLNVVPEKKMFVL